MKKFSFIIGNPPYQDEVQNKGDRPSPVYDRFMDAAFNVAETVELIHPARFLFNAGQTPKAWNKKMLDDEHLKVIFYESDSSKVFSNVEIKGGVAVTLRDSKKTLGPIGTFTSYPELNSIAQKVSNTIGTGARLDSVIASQGLYRFSDLFFAENPEAQQVMGKGTGNKIVSSVVEKLPTVFLENPPEGTAYVRFLGRVGNRRVYRYIRRDYLIENEYIDSFNLFIPEANNSGRYGETLTEPIISVPGDGATDTFLSAGVFQDVEEPNNLIKHMRTKFFRALLGIKKVTQHCPPPVWNMIPLENYTSASDIDWSKPIHGIDLQLYKKYSLTDREIEFIESHVKEMV